MDWFLQKIAETRKAWVGPLSAAIVLGANHFIGLIPNVPLLGMDAQIWVAGAISASFVWLIGNKPKAATK